MQNFSGTGDICDVSLVSDDLIDYIDDLGSVAIFSVKNVEKDIIHTITYIKSDMSYETLTITSNSDFLTVSYQSGENAVFVDEVDSSAETTVYDIVSADYILKQCDNVCVCTENSFFLPARYYLILAQTDNELFLTLYTVINAFLIGINIEGYDKFLDLRAIGQQAEGKIFASIDDFNNFFIGDANVESIDEEINAKLGR